MTDIEDLDFRIAAVEAEFNKLEKNLGKLFAGTACNMNLAGTLLNENIKLKEENKELKRRLQEYIEAT